MKKYVFLEGNKIPYGQDFSFHQGIDHNFVFIQDEGDIFSRKEDVWLRAIKHGLSPDYGNGAIVVRKKDLRLHKAFVRIVK